MRAASSSNLVYYHDAERAHIGPATISSTFISYCRPHLSIPFSVTMIIGRPYRSETHVSSGRNPAGTTVSHPVSASTPLMTPFRSTYGRPGGGIRVPRGGEEIRLGEKSNGLRIRVTR